MVDMNRRNFVKAVGSTGVVLSVGGVGTAAAKGKRKGASAEKNIVETAIALNSSGEYAGMFDELIDAVVASPGVRTVLENEDDQLTVFAPVDEGFENLDEVPSGNALVNVLKYHVTEGRRYSQSVVNAPELEMLNGGIVTVDGTELNDGQAKIIVTDVECSNGVIHAIGPVDDENGVLLP